MGMTEKKGKHLSLINFAILAVLLAFCVILYKQTQMLVFLPIAFSLLPIAIFSLLAYGRFYLKERLLSEQAQLDQDLKRNNTDNDLFEGLADSVKVVEKMQYQYVNYVVAVISSFVGIAFIALAWYWLNKLSGFTEADIRPNLSVLDRMGTLSIFSNVLVLVVGGYYVGVSRETGLRWLRAVGAWYFVFCGILVLGTISLFIYNSDRVELLLWMIKGSWIVLGILGIEILISILIEFYRPHILGEEERPVYESRLLGLFTEPGGIVNNLAASLDYQFGFKVSDAWFSKLCASFLLPVIFFLVLTLWGLTCIVQINVGEEGLKEVFGKIEKVPLQPGIYFKMPSPFANIIKYPTGKLDYVAVGSGQEEIEHDNDIILWAKSHAVEEQHFVTAGSHDAHCAEHSDKQKSASAYLMSATIPVYFRVKNLYDFHCNNAQPRELLATLAHRAISDKMVGVEFNELLTTKKAEVAQEIKELIQSFADQFKLGIEVSFIGFSEVHPPVEVGKDFDAVVSANIAYDNSIIQADIYAAKQTPQASSEAVVLINNARIVLDYNRQQEYAKKQYFESLLYGYKLAPRYLMLDQYLNSFDEMKNVKTYIHALPKGKKTYIFDQTEKITSGLLDVDLDSIYDNKKK